MIETVNAFSKRFQQKFDNDREQIDANDFAESILSINAIASLYSYKALFRLIMEIGKDILVKEEKVQSERFYKPFFYSDNDVIGKQVDLTVIPEKFRGILITEPYPEMRFSDKFNLMGLELCSKEVILEKVSVIFDGNAYCIGDYYEHAIRLSVKTKEEEHEELFYNEIGAGDGILCIVQGQQIRILEMIQSLPLWFKDQEERKIKDGKPRCPQTSNIGEDEEELPF